jgi:uncharacterized protein YbjT (DUF2867 family)
MITESPQQIPSLDGAVAVLGAPDAIARLARRARAHGLERVVLRSGRGEPWAQAAEATLTEPGSDGRVHQLTGPRAHSLDETAVILTRATGRRVAYTEVSVGQFADQLAGEGVPNDAALWLSGLLGDLLDGRNAHATDGVRGALGRPATSLEDWVNRVATAGGWS